jgi:hypothetical protein
MSELAKLEALGLKPYNPKSAVDDRKVFDSATRPACVIRSNHSVMYPNPVHMNAPVLLTRYEMHAAYDGPDGKLVTLAVAPGQLIPAFRRQGSAGWTQILRVLEIRAYAMPIFNGQVWVVGKDKPTYTDLPDLMEQPASREMRLSKPGGEIRVSPHPRIPGVLPMQRYDGKTVKRMLDATPLQAGDFLRLFGEHPVIEEFHFPFRFVTGNLEADFSGDFAAEGMRVLTSDAHHDDTAVNPMTGGKVFDLQDTNLPISFAYAEDVFDEFNSTAYDAGVRDATKDHSWIFVQHRLSPYLDTEVEDTLGYVSSSRVAAPFTREELPPGLFMQPWKFTKADPAGQQSLAPATYDLGRRFVSGVYNEMNG